MISSKFFFFNFGLVELQPAPRPVAPLQHEHRRGGAGVTMGRGLVLWEYPTLPFSGGLLQIRGTSALCSVCLHLLISSVTGPLTARSHRTACVNTPSIMSSMVR